MQLLGLLNMTRLTCNSQSFVGLYERRTERIQFAARCYSALVGLAAGTPILDLYVLYTIPA